MFPKLLKETRRPPSIVLKNMDDCGRFTVDVTPQPSAYELGHFGVKLSFVMRFMPSPTPV